MYIKCVDGLQLPEVLIFNHYKFTRDNFGDAILEKLIGTCEYNRSVISGPGIDETKYEKMHVDSVVFLWARDDQITTKLLRKKLREIGSIGSRKSQICSKTVRNSLEICKSRTPAYSILGIFHAREPGYVPSHWS
ncbi:hypothetical protein GCK72_022069 [Caenorhabditis remanei]|uniref:Uncharacterized protein n=1 Tax=Caenorhabditis remanei TaxID=31234 RepID=A0A6A5FSU0_CAERE|nr:hypothetical protein GCK72_022069 [Caenorhabditis remanei]KAF1745622.1 hypothetical protein GCK72_022069 [Caenorhabditis remanei]